MKNSAFLIFFCLAVSHATADCVTCRATLALLGKYLVTPKMIEKEMIFLKREMCVSDHPESFQYEIGVDQFWGSTIKGLFSPEVTPMLLDHVLTLSTK